MVGYVERQPAALARHLVQDYDLSAQTATLVRSVLIEDSSHKFSSAAIAIVGALAVGLNFGKVLQLVHLRAWDMERTRMSGDQTRYAFVLLALYGLFLLLFVQETSLAGRLPRLSWALSPARVGLLVAYFAWAPWILTQRQLAWRELVPGAALTAFGLVLLMLISSFVMEHWLNFYARDYAASAS